MVPQSALTLAAALLAIVAPTPLALHLTPRENCACNLPLGTVEHTLISRYDAQVEPESVRTRMTVGGNMATRTSGGKTAGGLTTVGGNFTQNFQNQWDFHNNPDNRVPVKENFDQVFNWADFEALAEHVVSGQYASGEVGNDCDDFWVFVIRAGGSFDLESFHTDEKCKQVAQGEDNGKTLVVFNTAEPITLKPKGGKQFGPSVLAPFSTVTLAANAGYMDGFLVAKNVVILGKDNQLHGDPYAGPLDCECIVSPTMSPTISKSNPTIPLPFTATSSPTMSPTIHSVSGEADPHLVNVRSERFDLMQPGNHTFLLLPRGATEDKAVLQLRAQVTARGDVCAGKLYITSLNISGSWLGTVGQLHLSTRGEAMSQSREVLGLAATNSSKMSLKDFLAAVPATMVKARRLEATEVQVLNQHVTMLSLSLNFGPGVIMRVDWEHQKEKVGFSNWLKLSSWGLSRAQMKVGGLLGEDDHRAVTELPQECLPGKGRSTLRGADSWPRPARGMVAASAAMDSDSDSW